jgi:hypothetical protein
VHFSGYPHFPHSVIERFPRPHCERKVAADAENGSLSNLAAGFYDPHAARSVPGSAHERNNPFISKGYMELAGGRKNLSRQESG